MLTLAFRRQRRVGIRDSDWSARVPSLERGTFDVVLNGLEVTPARAARLRLSRPYYAFAARLMARGNDPRVRADLAALQGFRVGTLRARISEALALSLIHILRCRRIERFRSRVSG